MDDTFQAAARQPARISEQSSPATLGEGLDLSADANCFVLIFFQFFFTRRVNVQCSQRESIMEDSSMGDDLEIVDEVGDIEARDSSVMFPACAISCSCR